MYFISVFINLSWKEPPTWVYFVSAKSEKYAAGMIDDRVRATEGGFEATNGFVRATIRVAVEKAQLSFESDLSDVVLALGVHDWSIWSIF